MDKNKRPVPTPGFSAAYPGSEYTLEEVEFLRAVDWYKTHVTTYPSYPEVLALVKALGYRKVAEARKPLTLKKMRWLQHPSRQRYESVDSDCDAE